MEGIVMHRGLMAAGLAGLLLTACGPKPGEQRAEGQKNEPVNIAQDVAGAATGVATGATGALDTEAFVKDAAIGGLYEIESSKLALKRALNPDVKAAAQMIIDDHSAADAQLKALVAAGKAPGPLPAALDERRKGMLDNLTGAAAKDFDDRYLDQQTMAHHEALLAFNGYAKAGDNADVKAFAAQTAPKLEHHAQMVTKLDRSTNADDEAGAGAAAKPNALGKAADKAKS
jgi:putative membrane protein